ncbi:MAG: hypothetical protein JWQ72_2346 [Polaromonas sp.]|nr:hypothetical protein [Polaromonas sp.]
MEQLTEVEYWYQQLYSVTFDGDRPVWALVMTQTNADDGHMWEEHVDAVGDIVEAINHGAEYVYVAPTGRRWPIHVVTLSSGEESIDIGQAGDGTTSITLRDLPSVPSHALPQE